MAEVSFTTIKVYRRDASALKQLQNLLEMRERSLNQSEFLHDLLDFAFRHEREFFRDMEREHEARKECMGEWMRVLAKRMQEI
ncbi:hypothetical protein HYS54_03190 [Candidatus Micrarchaeota archaeon]|nr:hypothetical protein [Candidatus Micrarchaeota archaeon]